MLRPYITVPLLCILLSALAGADQIAQFVQTGPTNDFMITDTGTSSTVTATSQVDFSFALALGTPFAGADRAATLTWTAISAMTASNISGHLSEGGYAGSFTITDNLLGTDLLSGTFGPAASLYGVAEGNSASFSDATMGIIFQSDYIDFSNSTAQAFSLALSNLSARSGLSFGGWAFARDNTAEVTGMFSATFPDPPAVVQSAPRTLTLLAPEVLFPQTDVGLQDPDAPEPLTQFMSGAALMGLGLYHWKRRRKRIG